MAYGVSFYSDQILETQKMTLAVQSLIDVIPYVMFFVALVGIYGATRPYPYPSREQIEAKEREAAEYNATHAKVPVWANALWLMGTVVGFAGAAQWQSPVLGAIVFAWFLGGMIGEYLWERREVENSDNRTH